jgi:PadR family transcriptional regulator AphA
MSLRNALLGLLSNAPMNGYTIKLLFDEAIQFVWHAELSQIYRELGELEKEGMVSSRIEQQSDRPNKRIYSITETGKKSLNAWLAETPETFSMPKRDEFMLKLFFGSLAGEEAMLRNFETLIRQMKRLLDTVQGPSRIAERYPNNPIMARADKVCTEDRYCRFIKKRAQMTAETIIRWAEDCTAEIRAGT